MAQQIQLRNDSTAGWAADNPVLAQAEVGVDTTLGKFKIGDGTSTWSELQFQSASIADFVFAYDSGDTESIMSVANHDMIIRTTRSGTQDADINLESADDIFITANGDDIALRAKDDVTITTDSYDGDGNAYEWKFDSNGRMTFPDGTIQSTAANGVILPADFLNWREGTSHLSYLNTNFGWDSDGVWFTDAVGNEGPSTSYPVFTDFTVAQNEPVIVRFDVNINDECSDVGVCVYVDGDTPEWNYGTNTTRIAAQFDCLDLALYGRTTQTISENTPIPSDGFFRVTFTYNPTATTNKVIASFTARDSDVVIASITLNEALPAGRYRVGFAADQNSSTTKTYISNLTIDVNNDTDFYTSNLQVGNSLVGSDSDLVLPVAIKDTSGDDFITFTRTSVGTARIETPQDDLSLRSARDITLIAGDDGPGNVYIGWGDATITPNASNRVATIGDIETAPRTYTANNEARYGTYQASGFVEVTSNAATPFTAQVYSPDGTYNVTSTTLLVDQTANDLLATNPSWREITIIDGTDSVRVLRNPSSEGPTEGGYLWSFGCDATLDLNPGTAYTVSGSYGGPPILWWGADNENPTNGDFTNSNFRGAKIEYHAYVSDGGTIIGTIYIADDSNDDNVTHMETASGGSDVGTAIFWNRSASETELCLYRTDGESVLHKIQWTAQMYYATEVYDD
jgi:hypothetical protein